jgi:uncharacterized protein (TIGR02145 family)
MKKHIFQFLVSLFIVCLLTIPFNSCNQTEVLPLRTELQETGSFVLPAEHTDLVTFGPMQFTRGTADPTIVEIQMNQDDFKCHIPPYKLYVVNGELDGKYRVTSALISVDGNVIFSQPDFSKKVEQLNQDVEITESSNIRVELRGQPGTYIHVYIIGVKGDCCSPSGTFVDERDGQVYKCVTIGEQVWMAENLKATRYLNGDEISYIINDDAWWNADHGAYAYYNHDAELGEIYGPFYNYFTVADPRGLCPAGWNVPSYDDFSELIDFLGGIFYANRALKSTGSLQDGTGLWNYSTNGTNSSGFQALPTGRRLAHGEFNYIHDVANFWTTTASYSGQYYDFTIPRNDIDDTRWAFWSRLKQVGNSVRCLKD